MRWLGRVEYGEALRLQEHALEARQAGRGGDVVLLLEHPPVVTRGRSARPENLLLPPGALRERGIALFDAARGGDVTYHAPGQLVGYPIVDLAARDERDVHRFLRGLEDVVIEVLDAFGLEGRRIEGKTGVFVAPHVPGERDRKIASIGIGVRRWVTWHGFALNVSVDLAGFDVIVPCGLEDVDMTSMAFELEREGAPLPEDLDVRVREETARALERRWA